MHSVGQLIAEVMTPSRRDEDAYTFAVIGIGHSVLGAALAGLMGLYAAPARLALGVGYWLAKERGDIKRGGSWRDGLIDTGFVGLGAMYTGAPWWPILVLCLAGIGAIIKSEISG